jgi:hypothetical protein
VKLDDALGHLWSRSLGGPGPDFAHDATLDGQGNLLVGGSFSAAFEHAGQAYPCAGGSDALVMKIDDAGDVTWIETFGRNEDDAATGVAIDDSDAVVVTGAFVDGFFFGEEVVFGKGMHDVFAMKLAP